MCLFFIDRHLVFTKCFPFWNSLEHYSKDALANILHQSCKYDVVFTRQPDRDILTDFTKQKRKQLTFSVSCGK